MNNNEQILKIPTPEMKLYSIDGIIFESQKSTMDYCKLSGSSYDESLIYELEYIRCFAGKKDIIKIKVNNILYLISAYDEDGYFCCDNLHSIKNDKIDWKYCYGNISEYYKAFRNRGIVFENDVYEKIKKRYKKILEVAR